MGRLIHLLPDPGGIPAVTEETVCSMIFIEKMKWATKSISTKVEIQLRKRGFSEYMKKRFLEYNGNNPWY